MRPPACNLGKRLEDALQMAQDWLATFDAIVDFPGLTVEMPDLLPFLEAIYFRSGLANVEPASHYQNEIGLSQGQISPTISITPDHADALRMGKRNDIHTRKRRHNRYTGLFGPLQEFLLRPSGLNTTARQNDGS